MAGGVCRVIVEGSRFAVLFEVIEELAGGNLDARFELSPHLDDVDAVGYALNVLAEELQDTIARLQRANETLSSYTHVVSHDLKAPVRAITNCVRFLSEDLSGKLEKDQLHHLQTLRASSLQAQRLIDDLLAYAQIGANEAALEDIDLGTVVEEVLALLALPAEVQIVLPGSWPRLHTHHTLVGQILANLLSNAAKFSSAQHRRVEVGWKRIPPMSYEVWVRDNGIGIEPRHQATVFEMFRRLHRANEFDGTGLGLAIVKRAVDELGGSVRIDSEPGEGSCFFVVIPDRSPPAK